MIQKSMMTGFFLISIAIMGYYGCSHDREDISNIDPDKDLSYAWQEYNTGKYEAAIIAFEKVLSQGAASDIKADAYNGIGWSYLCISQDASVNQKNIDNAIAKFQEAIRLDNNNADAWIGKAGAIHIRRLQSDMNNSIEAIDNALKGDAKYLYRHDYDSIADLYALKAQCYYYLGEMDKAKAEADKALGLESDNVSALAINLMMVE